MSGTIKALVNILWYNSKQRPYNMPCPRKYEIDKVKGPISLIVLSLLQLYEMIAKEAWNYWIQRHKPFAPGIAMFGHGKNYSKKTIHLWISSFENCIKRKEMCQYAKVHWHKSHLKLKLQFLYLSCSFQNCTQQKSWLSITVKRHGKKVICKVNDK